MRTAYVLLHTPHMYVHYKYITAWQYPIFKSSTDIWSPWHHWPTIDSLWDLRIFSGKTCITSYIYQTFFCSIPFHYCCTNERTWNTQLVSGNVTEAEPNRLLSMRMLFRNRIARGKLVYTCACVNCSKRFKLEGLCRSQSSHKTVCDWHKP